MKLLLLLTLTLVCNISIGQSQYFIVFKANPATSVISPGHAFVSFVKKDDALSQTIVEHTWGFHPINKSLKATFSTEGEVEKGKLGDLGKSDFVVEVDFITYEYCKKLKERWNSKRYGAAGINQNCVDFVKQLAELVTPELVMPSVIYQLPRPFLDALRNLNIKRDSDNRISLSKVLRNVGHQEELETNSNNSPQRNDINKPDISKPAFASNNLLGAPTYDALGKALLKAIQNNDIKTWTRYIHPAQTDEWHRSLIITRFKQYRDHFEENGVTNWSDIKFSRVTFTRFTTRGGNAPGVGETANVHVEFSYRNGDFEGTFSLGECATDTENNLYRILTITLDSFYMSRRGSK
ncbi:hypothetical protein [Runella sp.]|jgi:hypothetical protein|uniref:hypothetical protein n=1 Tax=Runella sp. TaxID=1960881 RepID=UPI002617599F|nr:hypothetical protein [Runella sp.]